MQESLLYITRKAKGIGGMQRLSADFIRAAQGWDNVSFQFVQPYNRLPFDFTFPFRALFVGAFHALQGHRIHLGDAALSPFLVLFRFLGARHMTVTACGLDVLFPNNFYQWMIRRALPRADKVICISKATAMEVQKRGVSMEKISVVPCGLHDSASSTTVRSHTASPKLITIGRLIPRKGVAWFLESVLPILLMHYPDMTYDVVGDGQQRRTIEQICRDKKLGRAVRIRGFVDESTKNELLCNANLFIMPNIPIQGDMEGFGIACIEASSRGVPVVAARLEGIEDAVIEGKTGFFFTTHDPIGCARAIQQALGAPLKTETVSAETTKIFSWEHLSKVYKYILFSAT